MECCVSIRVHSEEMITVYSKSACPNCDNAKRFLDQQGLRYREINIEKDSASRDFLIQQGHRSVPQFYCNDTLLVDGWDSLRMMSKEQINNMIANTELPYMAV
jgi:glutaredoxin